MRRLVLGLVLLITAPAVLPAQGKAFKTGEQITGMTKQCYYTYLGSPYTYTTSSGSLCPLSVSVPAPASSYTPEPQTYTRPTGPLGGGMAFKVGEQVTGTTKQCYYNYL